MERKGVRMIKDLLKEHLEDKEAFSNGLKEARIMRSWATIVGSDLVEYTSKLYIRDRKLYVSFTSSVAKSAFMARQREVLYRINQEVGEKYIITIRII